MSLVHSHTPRHEPHRGRRFSADEIRRQPEFRAIIASSNKSNKDVKNHDTKESTTCVTSKTSPNTTSIAHPDNNKGNAFRARSHTIPCTKASFPKDSIPEQPSSPPIQISRHEMCGESNTKHTKHDHIPHFTSHEPKQHEEPLIIFKNDEDMGIPAAKKPALPHRPKKAWQDPDDHTESRIVCHKMAAFKKRRQSPHDNKTLCEMTTVYEESITGDRRSSKDDLLSDIVVEVEKANNNLSTEILACDDVTTIDHSSLTIINGQENGVDGVDPRPIRQIQSAPVRSHSREVDEDDHDEESTNPTTHSFRTQAKKVTNAIHFQTSVQDKLAESEEVDAKSKLLMRQVSAASFRKYDAKLEKSAVYLRSRSRNFTRATQCMSAPKSGLRQLNVHYSQTNSCHNDRIIFTDLLKNSHVQNAIVADGVFAMERRLYNRRHEKGKSTTFYDRFAQSSGKPRPHSSPLPRNSPRKSKSPARTVADKKKERKDRIHKKDELLEFGYVPRMSTLESQGPEVIEDILMSCRYLRVTPNKQPWLYEDGEEP